MTRNNPTVVRLPISASVGIRRALRDAKESVRLETLTDKQLAAEAMHRGDASPLMLELIRRLDPQLFEGPW